MESISIFGWMFGIMGFFMAIAAMQKTRKLEAELKRRGVLDEKFSSEK